MVKAVCLKGLPEKQGLKHTQSNLRAIARR